MKVLLVLMLFSLNVFSEDLTVARFKEIIKGKESENIRKELKHIHIMKKSNLRMAFSYPEREPLKVSTSATEHYVANKYIVTKVKVPDNKPFYSIIRWNENEKVIEYWVMDPSEKISRFKGAEDKERKSRINWKGTTATGQVYKGYTDYSKSLISWEGKYTNPVE